MIDTILQTMVATWARMWSSPIIPTWFVVTTIVTTLIVMRVNDLNARRVRFYMLLFALLFIANTGPYVHFLISAMGVKPNAPSLWGLPTFTFTLFTCMSAGVIAGHAIKRVIDFFFEDVHLSMATWFYSLGESQLKQSKVFKVIGVSSVEGLQKLAEDQKVAQVAAELRETAVRAAEELTIVADTTASHMGSAKEVKS